MLCEGRCLELSQDVDVHCDYMSDVFVCKPAEGWGLAYARYVGDLVSGRGFGDFDVCFDFWWDAWL